MLIEKITVIDAPCGGGKTSWAIQLMRADTETSYIYCTPFLDEIDRIRKACGKYRFYEPKNFGTSKIEDFNKLLSQGRDIAVTHSTFLNATPKTVELIEQGEYTLILDEAPDIIGDFNKVASVENAAEQAINTHDVKAMLRDGLISIGDNSKVIWTGNDYAGTKYSEVERLAKLGRLYYANDSILCMFPPEVFLAFKKVYVMTYLLEGTFIKYYFDLFGISYEKATTINHDGSYELIEYTSGSDYEFRKKCKELATVCKEYRLNCDYKTNSFSKNWYDHNITDRRILNRLRTDLTYYFTRHLKVKSKDILWTCPKKYQQKVQGKGYTCVRQMTKTDLLLPEQKRKRREKELSCFVPLNARATNDYRDRWALAYCFNMFTPTIIQHFFNNCGHPVDNDKFAMACFIQWIFRSRIRDGKEIYIYLPSPRMRKLFDKWMHCDL